MPVRLGKIKETGADAFLHTCEECKEWGCFGVGVSYRRALNAIANDKIDQAKEFLGKWYCLTHWRELNEVRFIPPHSP